MPSIIVLFGPQQCGKSSAARALDSAHQFVKIAFAESLYEMLSVLFRMPVHMLRQLDKEAPQEPLGGKSIRYALQTLGTEWGRNTISNSIWVEQARARILDAVSKGYRVVIEDCRFRNEYEMLRDLGAMFVRIRRIDQPEQSNPGHGSEADWPGFCADATVVNHYTTASDWDANSSRLIMTALKQSQDALSPITR